MRRVRVDDGDLMRGRKEEEEEEKEEGKGKSLCEVFGGRRESVAGDENSIFFLFFFLLGIFLE